MYNSVHHQLRSTMDDTLFKERDIKLFFMSINLLILSIYIYIYDDDDDDDDDETVEGIVALIFFFFLSKLSIWSITHKLASKNLSQKVH